MSVKLYVGNLPYDVSEDDIRDKFNEIGYVEEVHLIIDRATGESKGFGFVDMANEDEAEMVIDDLDGMDWKGWI